MNTSAPDQEEIFKISEYYDQLELASCISKTHKNTDASIERARSHLLSGCYTLKNSMKNHSCFVGNDEIDTIISLLNADAAHVNYVLVHIYLDFFYISLNKGLFGDPHQGREGLTAPIYQILSAGPALTWSDPCVWRLDEKKNVFPYDKPLAPTELASERLLKVSANLPDVFAPELRSVVMLVIKAPHRKSARLRAAKAILARNILICVGSKINHRNSARSRKGNIERFCDLIINNWEDVRLISMLCERNLEEWLTQIMRTIKHDPFRQLGT